MPHLELPEMPTEPEIKATDVISADPIFTLNTLVDSAGDSQGSNYKKINVNTDTTGKPVISVDMKIKGEEIPKYRTLKENTDSAGSAEIDLTLHLEDIALRDLLDTIIVDVLESSYVLGVAPMQKISVNLQGSFTLPSIEDALRMILESMNLTLGLNNGVYSITQANSKAASFSSSMQVEVFAPHYLRGENLLPILRDVKSSGGKIATIQGSNIIFMLDYKDNVSRAEQVIKVFDVPFFANRHVRIYTLRNALASDVEKEMKKLLQQYELFAPKDPAGIQIVPLDRVRKIVVLASDKVSLSFMDSWIDLLDQAHEDGDGDFHLYTYKPLYVESAKIVATLAKIFKKINKGDTTGLESYDDKDSNVLIIKADKVSYRKARDIITAIDVCPGQVYVQVVLAEVSLGSNMNYGFQWFVKSAGNSGSLEIGAKLGDISSSQAFTVSWTSSDVFGILNQLVSNNNAKIVATPHVFVKDNSEALIEIKKEVPIIKSFLTTDIQQGGSSANQPSIEYKDAGIILKVKCRIMNNKLVDIEVDQEVSSPTQISLLGDLKSFEFDTRKVSTNLLVQSQHTAVIGGLREHTTGTSEDKVPILGDIPYLKHLFRARSSKTNTTELLLFISPVIVNNVSQMDTLNSDVKRLLGQEVSAGSPPETEVDNSGELGRVQ